MRSDFAVMTVKTMNQGRINLDYNFQFLVLKVLTGIKKIKETFIKLLKYYFKLFYRNVYSI